MFFHPVISLGDKYYINLMLIKEKLRFREVSVMPEVTQLVSGGLKSKARAVSLHTHALQFTGATLRAAPSPVPRKV